MEEEYDCFVSREDLKEEYFDKGWETGKCDTWDEIEKATEALKAENEKLKNTIVSLKSSVDDLREARDMRDHKIEKLEMQKRNMVQLSQKVRKNNNECIQQKVAIIKKLNREIDDWHKALNEPVEGLENLQSGINLHFWQRCSGPWDDDIDKINQN